MNRHVRWHLVIGLLLTFTLLMGTPMSVATAQPGGSPPGGPPDNKPGKPFQSGPGFERMPDIKAPPGLDGKEPPPGLSRRPDTGLLTAEGKQAKERANRGQADPTNKPIVMAPSQVEGTTMTATPHAPEPSAPVDGGSFVAVTDSNWFPPDAALAVGPYNLVAATNGALNIYKKNGAVESTNTLNGFFSPLGNVATDGVFDPIAEYDAYIDRFWVLAVSTNTNVTPQRATIVLALSTSNDATGNWSFFSFNARVNGDETSDDWCDYPQLGLDSQAIYITCNMFDLGSNSFEYSKIRAMTKDQFLNGTCCRWADWWDLREGFLNLGKSFTIQPAHMYGASTSNGMFLINGQGGGSGSSTLKVRHITNVAQCCIAGNQSVPDMDDATVDVGSFSAPPNAEQSGTTTALNTGDARLRFAIWKSGRLSTGQNLACNDGDDACVAFTELNVSSFPSISVVNDWAYQNEGINYFYPSVDVNNANDKTMVFGRSSPSEFASARYVGIPKSSTCTDCVDGPEVVLQAGQNSYVRLDNSGRNRWGDYFSASPDPDGTGIWIMGQFAVATANQWGMQVGLTYKTIDTTAPVTTATISPAPNAAGWNNSNVTVSLSSSDNASGVRTLSYTIITTTVSENSTSNSFATIPVTAEGNTIIAFWAEDNWGNVETTQQITIRLDKTKPVVSCDASDGQWHGDDVSLSCTASDALSGLANFADANFALTTDVAEGTETDNAFTDSHDVTDVAGNVATAGPIGGNKVDKKAPEINVTVPNPDGSSIYTLNQSVTASYTCADGGSGVQSCTDTGVDTSAVGNQTVTVSAVDNVGNDDERVVDYIVAYDICYLYDQDKTVNRNSTIPIRIQLCDANGNNVSAPSIAVQALRVDPGGLTPASSLNPDGYFTYASIGGVGGYIYTLDGRNTGLAANMAYQLIFVADGDPTEHTAGIVTK